MLINNEEYFTMLAEIKSQIATIQSRALFGLNRELITLYWQIGQIINKKNKYGSSFIDNLARDIKIAFPNMSGYSARNLRYMSKFAGLFSDSSILQEPLAKLTWYHLQGLMDRVHNLSEFLWYAQKAFENGWSRNVLVHQIEIKLYERQTSESKISNFERTLTPPQNELVKEMQKDPYIYGFVEQREGLIERDIENELIANMWL